MTLRLYKYDIKLTILQFKFATHDISRCLIPPDRGLNPVEPILLFGSPAWGVRYMEGTGSHESSHIKKGRTSFFECKGVLIERLREKLLSLKF